VRWEGGEALAPGRHTLAFDFKYDGGGLGKGGLGVLSIDGKEVDTKRMEQTIPFILQWDEAFNVGIDTGTPVEPADYQVPFPFNGKLEKVAIELKGPPLSEEVEEQKKQMEEQFHKSQ
jgi:arylsulfatase